MTAHLSPTQRAVKLPAPVPGQPVDIPLELLPIWLAAHRLEVMDLGQVAKVEQAKGQHKPDGVVLVKRLD